MPTWFVWLKRIVNFLSLIEVAAGVVLAVASFF